MEKEKILETLRTEIGETSFSDRTIEAYLNANPVAEGEEPSEDYFKNAATFIKAMQGQFNHDIAEFKKTLTPTPPTPPAPPSNEGKEDSEVMKLLKQMQEANEALKKRLDDKEEVETQAQLRKQVIAGMKAKGATNDYVLGTTLKGVKFDGSKTVDEQVEKYISEYDKELKLAYGSAAVPRKGNDGGSGNQKSDVDKYFERKWKQK